MSRILSCLPVAIAGQIVNSKLRDSPFQVTCATHARTPIRSLADEVDMDPLMFMPAGTPTRSRVTFATPSGSPSKGATSRSDSQTFRVGMFTYNLEDDRSGVSASVARKLVHKLGKVPTAEECADSSALPELPPRSPRGYEHRVETIGLVPLRTSSQWLVMEEKISAVGLWSLPNSSSTMRRSSSLPSLQKKTYSPQKFDAAEHERLRKLANAEADALLASKAALRDRAEADLKSRMDDANLQRAAEDERELHAAKAYAEKLGIRFSSEWQEKLGVADGKSSQAAGTSRSSLAAHGKQRSGRINGGGRSGRVDVGGGGSSSGGGVHDDGGGGGGGGGGNDGGGGNGDGNGAQSRGGRSSGSKRKDGKGECDAQNGRASGSRGNKVKGKNGKGRGDEEEIDETDPKARERMRIKALTIDWEAISHALPLGKDPEMVQKRKALFEEWDVNSNKHLSHSEVDSAMKKIMEELTPGLVGSRGALYEWGRSWKPIIMRAFQRSKASNAARKSKEKRNDNYIERDEFRLLLVCIRQFFEMFIAFARIDTNVDRKIDKDEVNHAGVRGRPCRGRFGLYR